jgi:tRNA (guanosine-2'-O-)-methyltransferase
MSSERRVERMRAVLRHRLGRVRVVVEAVYHRHNVSAILRTCDALGVQVVHLVGAESRLSRGPARGAERWLTLHHHPDAGSAVERLRADGFRIWVADLAGDPVAPEGVPLDRPVALWFGAELVGVSTEARAAADGVVTIPMYGMAQSLNVSVAAALATRPVAERARASGDRLEPSVAEGLLAAWIARDEQA